MDESLRTPEHLICPCRTSHFGLFFSVLITFTFLAWDFKGWLWILVVFSHEQSWGGTLMLRGALGSVSVPAHPKEWSVERLHTWVAQISSLACRVFIQTRIRYDSFICCVFLPSAMLTLFTSIFYGLFAFPPAGRIKSEACFANVQANL